MIASLLALAMLATSPAPYPTEPTAMPVYIIRENGVVVGWDTDGEQGVLEVVLKCPQAPNVDICWVPMNRGNRGFAVKNNSGIVYPGEE